MVRFSVDSCLLVQTTFTYSSKYWTNKQELQPSAGTTRLGKEQKETKLATYHKTPFKYICLAFMVNKNFAKYVLLRMEERQPSLHSVISKNVFVPVFVGRDLWSSAVQGVSLQKRCNKEGINARDNRYGGTHAQARIGIIANDQSDCRTCDSFVGVGTFVQGCHARWLLSGTSAGNANTCSKVANPVFVHVLVR